MTENIFALFFGGKGGYPSSPVNRKNPLSSVYRVPLGRGLNIRNGNLGCFFPLGVGFQTFFYPTFSFTIESYIDETDFTLGLSQKYLFQVLL